MSSNQDPLKVENIIGAGVRLYRDRFKTYLGISLIANLWLLVPFLLLIALSLLGIFLYATLWNNGQTGTFILLIVILILFWIIFTCYCAAKFLINAALISKLAFGVLINKLEPVTEARAQLKTRTWRFWLTQFLTSLLLYSTNFGWHIFQKILFNLPESLIGSQDRKQVIESIGYLLYLIGYGWLYARLFFTELPLAIEIKNTPSLSPDSLTVGETINRSWKLTQGFGWRILFIIIVATLISLPVYLLSGFPLVFAAIYSITNFLNKEQYLFVFAVIVYSILGATLIFIFLNIAILPFWQALKSVIYYALRSRREGLKSLVDGE